MSHVINNFVINKTHKNGPVKMSEWQELVDTNTGAKYYYNTKYVMSKHLHTRGDESLIDWPNRTGDTAWEKPSDFDKPKTIELGNCWQMVLDDNSGQYYYYNTATQLSTWTRPKELDAPVEAEPILVQHETHTSSPSTADDDSYQQNNENYHQQQQHFEQDYQQQQLHIGEMHLATNGTDSLQVTNQGVFASPRYRAHSTSSPSISISTVDSTSPQTPVPHIKLHDKAFVRRSTILTTGSTARGTGASARRRPSSSASFQFSSIPEKCTGRHTLVTYGQSKFQQHRKGFFRSVVPTNKLLLFSKSSLSLTLHEIPRENHVNDCLLFFDLLQLYMLDRKYKDLGQPAKDQLSIQKFAESDADKLSKDGEVDVKLAKILVTICLREVVIRNECIVLTCKQCNGNPTPAHTVRGLQVLGLLVTAFPPTAPNLQEAVIHFLQVLQLDPRATDDMQVYCKANERRFRRSILTGPRKSLPSDTEFRNMTQQNRAALENHVFGVTIEEYMNWQSEHILDQANEHNNDPVVLVVLAEILEKLHGLETEGIFRLPGHTAQVERLRDELSSSQDVRGTQKLVVGSWIKDPHVCASVFKLWLRELADPIIPDDMYEQSVSNCADAKKCVDLAKTLPDDNRIILNFVIHFLSRLCADEVTKKTKMNLENLAVVFAPNILRNRSTDPMAIMRNSNSEKQFVKTLVQANLEAATRGEI